MSENRKNRSSQRRGRQMAKTNKTITTVKSDGHLGLEDHLSEDSLKQLEHANKVRAEKGLPPISYDDLALLPDQPDDVGTKTLDEQGDRELVAGSDLIVGLRVYSRTGGIPVGRGVEGAEFCAVHSRVRREREIYRELNGQKVKVGAVSKRSDKTGKRKDLTRKAPGILKSIMVRLMAHEGLAIEALTKDQLALGGEALTKNQLAEAMDATVAEFEKATDCEVVTAAAHRMSETDCHIHIQYTMVQALEETKTMLGRRMRPWKELASKMARESLAADDISNPAPAAIGARKNQLIASGLLSPPPEAGLEYCKLAGLRNLGDGAILGYSFRQKLNLVRAAEAGGEAGLGKEVTKRNDSRGRFEPIAKMDDANLDAKYLDLWLERVWRQNVTSRLPETSRAKLIADGVKAARNYAKFGTSLVEKTHIETRIKELEAEAKKIETIRNEVKKASQEAALAIEMAEKRTRDLEEREEDLRAKSKSLRDAADQAMVREEQVKLKLAKAQESVDEANAQVESLRVEVEDLRDRGDLFDRVVRLLAQVFDLPGVGMIARVKSKLWNELVELGPKIGLANKLAAIASVGNYKPKKSDPDQGNPGNRG